MRLSAIYPEYQGRVELRERPFPLEIHGGEPAPRDILEQEWWLAALQESQAKFNRFPGDDWPSTTMPAFQATWAVMQMEPGQAHDFDLRIRRAFFAEGRNIGKRETMLDLANEAGLNLASFSRLLDSDQGRKSILEEAKLGREQFKVHGTPTLMLSDGTRLRQPIAFPRFRGRRIVSVDPLPCHGQGCLDATRALFEQVLKLTTPGTA